VASSILALAASSACPSRPNLATRGFLARNATFSICDVSPSHPQRIFCRAVAHCRSTYVLLQSLPLPPLSPTHNVYRPHDRRTESTQAARATRAQWSRRRSGRPFRWDPARPSAGNSCITRLGGRRPRPRRRASSVGRVRISPAPAPSANKPRRRIDLRGRQGIPYRLRPELFEDALQDADPGQQYQDRMMTARRRVRERAERVFTIHGEDEV
jgi:hypothetical protein